MFKPLMGERSIVQRFDSSRPVGASGEQIVSETKSYLLTG
ncbi:hypothetical protein VPHD518_0065 [Vibrio phage D518]